MRFHARSIPFAIHAKMNTTDVFSHALWMAEEPIEQIKTTNSWSKQNADQADVRKCKETKIRISKGKNAFFATISLFLDSPLFLFFFYLWESFLRRVCNFQEHASRKYEKKLRVGVNERRQIQSKLTEMLMVERQIDADSTNLAKTNKSWKEKICRSCRSRK